MKVKELMSEELVTIEADRSLRDAMRKMEEEGVSRLLVTKGGEIVGIITEYDVAKRLGSWKERRISDARIFVSSAYTRGLKCIGQEESVKEAARTMLENGISSLVVRDESGRVVGIVTKTDVVKALRGREEKVEGWMKVGVVTLPVGSTLLHARRLMLENKIKRIPVLLDGRIVGMLTEKDVARALGTFRKVVEGRHWEERMKKILVEDVMSKDVITIRKTASLGDAVETMLEKGVSGLPVVDEGGKLVGIVTKTDLLRAVVDLL